MKTGIHKKRKVKRPERKKKGNILQSPSQEKIYENDFHESLIKYVQKNNILEIFLIT